MFQGQNFYYLFYRGIILFIIFSSYYTNIQGRNTMPGLIQEIQAEELMIIKEWILLKRCLLSFL